MSDCRVETDIESTSLIQERYDLVLQRIKAIAAQSFPVPELEDYFRKTADFLLQLEELSRRSDGALLMGDLLSDLKDGAYGCSYGNPAYAVQKLGWTNGKYLSFLYYELKGLAGCMGEKLPGETQGDGIRVMELLIHMELFVEVYTAFVYEWEGKKDVLDRDSLRQIFYWFVWDYGEMAAENYLKGRVNRDNPSILYRDWILGEADGFPVGAAEADRAGISGEADRAGISGKCREDHAEDLALVLDRPLAGRLLEVLHSVLEEAGRRKGEAPARKVPGEAHDKKTSGQPLIHFDEGQRQLWEKYCRKRTEMYREYFPGSISEISENNF